MNIGQPEFWDKLLKTKTSTERVYYSERGHKKRILAISDLMESLSGPSTWKRILDLGCGVGDFFHYTSQWIKPQSVGIDFCEASIEEATVKYPDHIFFHRDVRDVDFISRLAGKKTFFQFVVANGLFMIQPTFPTTESCVRYISNILWNKKLKHCTHHFIANFLWDRYIPSGGHEGLKQDSMDNLVTLAFRNNLSCCIYAGYLPHEFIAVFARSYKPMFDKGVKWI